MEPRADVKEATTFLRENPDITAVDVLIADSCGVWRGKRIPAQALERLYLDGCSFPGSIYAMDITGETVAGSGLVWEQGDADQPCLPVPGTLVRTPWLKRPTAQLLLQMYEHDGRPYEASPRSLVRSMAGLLAADGLFPVVAVELEFYLLDSDWGEDDRPRPPLSPNSGVRHSGTQVYGMDELSDFDAVLTEIYETAVAQRIPADAAVAEYAPGQFEINLHHVPDPVRAADDGALFKRVVRGVAGRHKLDATFMAKPYPNHAGSGMHVHVSLLDRDGNNVLEGNQPYGSETLRHAVGGLAATMGEGMIMFAPNANSYRRFQVDSYAPTAPTWAVNNRTAALRVIGSGNSRRIEHRLPGADANPYLVVATILAGMHHGIRNQIDPGAPLTGNGYEVEGVAPLPASWNQALNAFERSRILREYFGEKFSHAYLTMRRAEAAKFAAYVTPLEYEWYVRSA